MIMKKKHVRFEAKEVLINKSMLTISIQSTKDQKHKSNNAIRHNKTECTSLLLFNYKCPNQN